MIADRGEVAGPVARRRRGADRRLLGADAERVRGVLDVDARELAAVARAHDRADEVVRVRRVRASPARDSLLAARLWAIRRASPHENTWKTTSAASAPSRPPEATSSAEWTPDSTRVCATSNAMISAIDETRKRWDAPAT